MCKIAQLLRVPTRTQVFQTPWSPVLEDPQLENGAVIAIAELRDRRKTVSYEGGRHSFYSFVFLPLLGKLLLRALGLICWEGAVVEAGSSLTPTNPETLNLVSHQHNSLRNFLGIGPKTGVG